VQVNTIAGEQNSTIVFPFPVEFATWFAASGQKIES